MCAPSIELHYELKQISPIIVLVYNRWIKQGKDVKKNMFILFIYYVPL